MAIIAGVTAGAAFAGAAAAVVAGRAFDDAGDGADAVELPPELHAAIAAAATMNRVGRTTRL